jgi:hypothetical protein
MSMRCKKCGESLGANGPFDVFEFRRHKLMPADSDGMVQTDALEDSGAFCSRKCLTDYLAAEDKSGVFNLAGLREKLRQEGKL